MVYILYGIFVFKWFQNITFTILHWQYHIYQCFQRNHWVLWTLFIVFLMNQGHNYFYTAIHILIMIYIYIYIFISIELYFIHHSSADKILNIISFIQWNKVMIISISYYNFHMVIFQRLPWLIHPQYWAPDMYWNYPKGFLLLIPSPKGPVQQVLILHLIFRYKISSTERSGSMPGHTPGGGEQQVSTHH